jgi:hypothetical protein
VDDVLKNWSDEHLNDPNDGSELPEFTTNPSQRTTDIVWRHLVNPADDVESLSQELAETTVDASRDGDLYLERSLQIFTNRYDDDLGVDANEDDEMDLCHPSEYSELTISTPTLAGYDFDINEISELEDLPDANSVLPTLHKKYSIIVAIVEISPCQLVTTKFGKSISLINLVAADQTCGNFEIACWDQMASFAQTMRVNDIIHLRGKSSLYDELIWMTDIGLTEFRGVVSAGTRQKSRASILYRCRRLHKEDDVLRPRLDLMDQQTRFVRRLRDWVVRKSAIMARDVPPTLETQES